MFSVDAPTSYVPPRMWMYLNVVLDFARTNGIVAHAVARVQSPLSVPFAVTKKTSASALHVPSDSRQTPPGQSASDAHPRHSCDVVSQSAFVTSVHCELLVQAT